MNDSVYITTTIPYVKAPPHDGHALEFLYGCNTTKGDLSWTTVSTSRRPYLR